MTLFFKEMIRVLVFIAHEYGGNSFTEGPFGNFTVRFQNTSNFASRIKPVFHQKVVTVWFHFVDSKLVKGTSGFS